MGPPARPAPEWDPFRGTSPSATYTWGSLPTQADSTSPKARSNLPDPLAPTVAETLVVNPVPPPSSPRPASVNRSLVLRLGDQRFDYLEDDWVVHSGPISSGREGYETPTGQFSVGAKEKNKYSTLYENDLGEPAWMPWSIQFQGDYFVHEGWLPGYPASHGCVRVGEKDAEFLFANLKRGDPVVVTN